MASRRSASGRSPKRTSSTLSPRKAFSVELDESELDQQEAIANKRIEQELKSHRKKLERELKVLLLGTGSCGKTTFARQMKIIHGQGYADEERRFYAPLVHRNLIDAVRKLAEDESIDLGPEAEAAESIAALSSNAFLTSEHVKVVRKILTPARLAEHDEFQRTELHRYVEDLERICVGSDFMPSNDDILRVRVQTRAVSEMIFSLNRTVLVRMIDVAGQKNARRKWIHHFDKVSSMIFIVAISDYDLKDPDEPTRNALIVALELFDTLINSEHFFKTNVILFLNKHDVFRAKITKIDMKICFPSYSGGMNSDLAIEYLKKEFSRRNKNKNRYVYCHVTTATDTENIKFVFNAIQDTLLTSNLAGAGFY